MENLLGGLIGVCLSAVCGFRVFVPLLGVSIAVKTGHLSLTPGMDWLGSWPALIAFAVATALEITAYYIPLVDNFMDGLATPVSVAAGVIVMFAALGDTSPLLRVLAIIAGGGAAGTVQASTVILRAAGQATAPLLATPVITTTETAGSVLGTVLALAAPVLGAVIIITLCLLLLVAAAWRLAGKFRIKKAS